ncbi:hypothetical protein F2Q68_00009835 [Brassica cretica]|uniref:Uncharacterized protein n=1 Tax=Brassica cretica TaxID=69181 RepID=A0A8S9KSG9_BRACR|nr:hypothetical protein F2Q68_00009835 [Brassica cretica]
MNAHEAEAAAGQAVSKVEAAMTAAEEAAKEADAAEAARAYAEEASKTLKGKKNICKVGYRLKSFNLDISMDLQPDHKLSQPLCVPVIAYKRF